jgi:hypothetical protein
MEVLKNQFLTAIQADPSLLRYKWAELEKMFNIPSTRRPGDRARKWWRNLENSGKRMLTSEDIYTPEDSLGIPIEEPTPSGLKVKSVWQVQGKGGEVKTLKSYEATGNPFEESKALLLKDLEAFSPKVKLSHVEPIKDGHMLEIAIPDFHIGRLSIEESRELFLSALSEILVEAAVRYPISKIVFPVGNDWLNTDTLDYTTTRGTKQFDVNPWYETFRYGWQILAEGILIAANLAPVDVIVVQGNHDKARMFYIGDVLAAYFRNNDNVTVDNTVSSFKFTRFGQTLIMYEHGELKPSDYPLILADERKEDWAQTKYREVHLGHFHKEMTLDEYRGVKVRHLPSLSSENLWEKERGYNHLRQAQGLLWNADRGLRTTFYYNGD